MHSLEISHYQVVFTQGIWKFGISNLASSEFQSWKVTAQCDLNMETQPEISTPCSGYVINHKMLWKKVYNKCFFTVNPLHWYHILHCRFSGFGLVVGPQLLAPFSFSLVLRLTLIFLLDVCCRNSKSNNAVIMIVKCYVTEKTICRAWTVDSPW